MVYENKSVPGQVADFGVNVQVLAKPLVGMLKPELQQMLGDFEARVADSVNLVNASVVGSGVLGNDALVEAAVSTEDEPATTVQEPEKKPIVAVREEKIRSGTAISYWKGLDDD